MAHHKSERVPMAPLPPSSATTWNSIYIAGCCAFIQSTQFSIFFSSMWPYLLKLQPDVRQNSFGIVVSLYSFSQCICSPLFGYWSVKIGEVKIPLIVGFTIMCAGNVVYLFLQFLSSYHLYVMMLSRFISGAGTGNMTLLRSYASSASTTDDRSRALACVSGGIAVGSMLGPALQLLFIPLGEDGTLNIYNSPALLSLLLDILGLGVVHFHFQEQTVLVEGPRSADSNPDDTPSRLASPDAIALMVCIATRFTQIFVQTAIEAIGSAYSMMMFSFEKEEAVNTNAAVHAVAGTTAALLYVFFIFLQPKKFIRARIFSVGSLVGILVMFVSTYSYPFIGKKVKIAGNDTDADCDLEKYEWCSSLTAVSIWMYYAGYILVFGIVNSFLNISCTTLYSKVVGPRAQGNYQGFFQMAGSIGRLIAPLLMSVTYAAYGPQIPWLIAIGDTALVILLWLVFHRNMVPFEKSNKFQDKKLTEDQ